MCAPSTPKDRSAEIAAQREAERQAAITKGRNLIDSAFGGFTDQFYDDISGRYVAYYNPQLDRQGQEAAKKLKLRLASSGILNSSSGARLLGDLQREWGDKRAFIANSGIDEANKVRADVERARSDLLSLNQSAADPAAVALEAQSRAGTLQAPQGYSPLVSAFGSFLNDLTLPIGAEMAGYRGTGTGLFAPKKGGSVSVIR